MKAVATAEKRPAYSFISGIRHKLAGRTHKYQDGIKVIVVLSVKVLVVIVRLFPELFVEARLRFWFLFRECRLDRCGQVTAQSKHTRWECEGEFVEQWWCVNRTSAVHPHPRSGSSPEHPSPRQTFDQVSVLGVSLRWTPWSKKSRNRWKG